MYRLQLRSQGIDGFAQDLEMVEDPHLDKFVSFELDSSAATVFFDPLDGL